VVDVRPVFNPRLQRMVHDTKTQDEAKRRYVEDKWRYSVFPALFINVTAIIN